MSEETLMKLMLSTPDLVRKIQLSDAQIDIVRLVQRQEFGLTATALSNYYDISIQSASTQLKALWLKSYLLRLNIGDGTGGTVYEYRIVEALQDIDIPHRLRSY